MVIGTAGGVKHGVPRFYRNRSPIDPKPTGCCRTVSADVPFPKGRVALSTIIGSDRPAISASEGTMHCALSEWPTIRPETATERFRD
jgi:hypothetical protein